MDNRMHAILPVRPMRPLLNLWTAAALVVPAIASAAPFWPEGDVDGAITAVANWGPDYLGARDRGVSLRPGFFLRWKRLSVSSGGGWASPRRDDDVRGLGLEVTRSDTYRISLGLRLDSGRQDSSSPALAGMGNIKRTVRARASAIWNFEPQWELRVAWTIDAFGRGGGNLVETKLQHDWPISSDLYLTSGVTVALGGPTYMQTYFGVTPEQAARSGYPVYEPDTSLRDLALFTSLRWDFSDDWVGTAGIGWTRMLGDAARSPLTQRRDAWSASAGIGWRF